MFEIVRPAFVLMALFSLTTGLLYPLALTAIAQVAFPFAANGSILRSEGKAVGSALIGQQFASDRYFRGRPSATSAPDPNDESKTVDAPYNAAASGGSNLGPLSKKLMARLETDTEALRDPAGARIPGDAVTTSASGLDPHISLAYALLQVERVAKARQLSPKRIRLLVEAAVEHPWLGLVGEVRINVLQLNLALDRLKQT